MNSIKESEILMEIAEILKDVSKEEGLYIDYAKICWSAMRLLQIIFDKGYQLPVKVKEIYDRIHVRIQMVNLNEFMEGGDVRKINRIIGKISIRPDYITSKTKITVYVDEDESPAMINYALAHELCHLILNYKIQRYTDDYSTMPMLPKESDELVADTFAVFLLIPFDKFLEVFKEYVQKSKDDGNIPIGTKDWLNYLSSVASVPYHYVACAYQQIRHVAFLMYQINKETSGIKRKKYEEKYGKVVMSLYESIKDKMDKEVLAALFQ